MTIDMKRKRLVCRALRLLLFVIVFCCIFIISLEFLFMLVYSFWFSGGSHFDDGIIRRHSASVRESSEDFFAFVKEELRLRMFPGTDAFIKYTVKRLDLKPLRNISLVTKGDFTLLF